MGKKSTDYEANKLLSDQAQRDALDREALARWDRAVTEPQHLTFEQRVERHHRRRQRENIITTVALAVVLTIVVIFLLSTGAN